MSEPIILKKNVHLIHCATTFSLVQRKLVNALLINAYSELPSKTTHMIRTKDLCDLIGFTSRDIKSLKLSLKGLLSTIIEWNVLGNSSESWSATTMLASANITKGVCAYSYSDIMRKMLHQPEMYGRIDIGIIKLFRSSYSVALYENCVRYKNIKKTSWFPMQSFRKLMGISEDKYKEFRYLKKRVIDVGVKEINELSPINIRPQLNSNKTEIRFLIELSKKEEPSKVVIKESENKMVSTLDKVFGIQSKKVNDILERYDNAYVKEKIDMIVDSPSFKSGKIKNRSAYFLDSLTKDYKPAVSTVNVSADLEREKYYAEKTLNDKSEKEDEKYQEYIEKTYQKIQLSIKKEEYIELKNRYIQSLAQTAGKMYQKSGFDHPMVKYGFKEVLKENYPEHFSTILSKKDFIDMIGD